MYRKIEVNDVQYRWVSGKVETKVQRLDSSDKPIETMIFKNEEWATPVEGRRKFKIGPAEIKGMINGERYWKAGTVCKKHGKPITALAAAPFDMEIYQKVHLMSNCPDCLDDNAQHI